MKSASLRHEEMLAFQMRKNQHEAMMNERIERLRVMEDTMRKTLENQDYMREQ